MAEMFRCILCLRELADEDSSLEHVFPEALGGRLTLTELCRGCNSHLGSNVDSRLVNHSYIGWARKSLGLAGKTGRIPNPLGDGVVVPGDDPMESQTIDDGEPRQRVRWDRDGVYYHPFVEKRDGQKVLVVDKSEAHLLPQRLAKAKARRGKDLEGAVREQKGHLLSFDLGFQDDGHVVGILKIAYEMAFLALGHTYLDDDMARRLRAVLEMDPLREDWATGSRLYASFAGLNGRDLIPLRPECNSWLIGLVCRVPNHDDVVAYVRLFDRFEASITVSQAANLYALSSEGVGWVIDVRPNEMREIHLKDYQSYQLTGPPTGHRAPKC